MVFDISELVILYEVSSLSLPRRKEALVEEIIEKANRLLGVQKLALEENPGDSENTIHWGFTGGIEEARKAMREEKENSFTYSMESRLTGRIYLEQEAPLSPEDIKLYTVFTRKIEETLGYFNAREALCESEKKHRRLFETMVQGVIYQKADGKIISANPAAERILGLSFQELQGKTFMDLPWKMVKEDGTHAPKTEHPAMVALRTGKKVGPVTRGVFHPGKNACIWLNITAIPLFHPGETEPYQAYATYEDITQQKQAEEALKHRYELEKMVSKISSKFINLPWEEIDEGINYTLKKTGEFFEVDRSYIFQLSLDGQCMSNTHEWCFQGIKPWMDIIQNRRVDSLPWLAERLQKDDYIHIPYVDQLPAEAEAERKEFQRQDIKSLLVVPLRSKERLMGFFGFDSVRANKIWWEETINFFQVIADILISAFEKNKAEENILYISFHDSLTGLYNRYYLEKEMERLDTQRQLPISIIMADLNGLKLINDTYGYSAGDKMLIRTASILNKVFRQEDIIARWGGDDFVILLPRTTKEEASAICRRIDDECSKDLAGDVPISITAGVASKDNAEIDLAEVLKEAEDNMYKHKLTESRSVRSAVLNGLLRTLGEKSHETEIHTLRMQAFAFQIGEKINLPDAELNRLSLLIPLHDIGKINIPEEILTKKNALTRDEWELIKTHPEIGCRIARATEDFNHVAEDIFAHHERWDGSGYPRGLKGIEIPLLARITAIADSYEVMTNGRPYQKAMSQKEAADELKRCAGTQFDPELVEAFLSVLETEAEKEIDE